jgi:ribose transport system permease protein
MKGTTVSQSGIEDEPVLSPSGRFSAWIRGALLRAYRGENAGALVLVMLVIIGIFAVALRDTSYFTSTNFLNIVRQTSAITVMAVPTVFVISSGEMDLSIAAVVPVSAFICALLLPDYGPIIAPIVALAFGAFVGFINGSLTTRFRIPSFVVTLGMLSVLNGIALRITNVKSIAVLDPAFIQFFGGEDLGPVPVLLIWSLVVVLVGFVLLAWTPAGRAVLATGANPNAARFSGIRTDRVKVCAMVASSMGGALAGLLYEAQFGAASYTLGTSDMLSVFAAAIIGGTALAGGKGSVIGALIGSLLIGVLNNGLIIIGLANPEQLMARGAIIIGAVLLSARTAGYGGGRFGGISIRRTPKPGEPAAALKSDQRPDAQ